jgi:8-oxo-dGTP diphosphatase
MKFKNTPNRCLTVDGEVLWISRSVTVLPVLLFAQADQTYVPLNKRGPALPDEVGKWSLPGGYLDYDETVGDAVIREVWEELGLNIPALQAQHRFIGTLEQPHRVFSAPIRRQNVTLQFPLLFDLAATAELPPLQPQVDQDEVEAADWFTLEAALSMDLAFNHQEVIRDFLLSYFQEQALWKQPQRSAPKR